MSILYVTCRRGGGGYWYWGRILGSFRGFGAILGNKFTVSGLNMTHNAFYHLNKVYIYIILTLFKEIVYCVTLGEMFSSVEEFCCAERRCLPSAVDE